MKLHISQTELLGTSPQPLKEHMDPGKGQGQNTTEHNITKHGDYQTRKTTMTLETHKHVQGHNTDNNNAREKLKHNRDP